jgi:hypothetical protein
MCLSAFAQQPSVLKVNAKEIVNKIEESIIHCPSREGMKVKCQAARNIFTARCASAVGHSMKSWIAHAFASSLTK